MKMAFAKMHRLLAGRLARVVALGVGSLAVLALAGESALGEVVQTGNLIIGVQGSIHPARLPKNTLAPIALEIGSTIKTSDGSRVPVLSTLSLEFNKHGAIETKGIATCSVSQLENTLTAQAERICGKALVGTGSASGEISLPEQAPFEASGPMLIFNGKPQGGQPVLIVHVYAHVPAPTTFVTTAVVKKASGKYGPSIRVKIPTIVGGQGSLISFNATLHKIVRADCPAPGALGGTVFPFAKASFTFANGISASSDLVRECQVKK
jgi:hypothetical protein